MLSALIFFSLVLGYGYWHARTHGYFYFSIYDARADNPFVLLKNTEIILRDKQNEILAVGQSEARSGVVYLSHPETGSCYQAEQNAAQSSEGRAAWQRCFKTHSIWLLEWIRRVQAVDIQINDCNIERIPVVVKENIEDWWTWWIPNPHGGGKPYTYFNLMIRIDPSSCRVIH